MAVLDPLATIGDLSFFLGGADVCTTCFPIRWMLRLLATAVADILLVDFFTTTHGGGVTAGGENVFAPPCGKQVIAWRLSALTRRRHVEPHLVGTRFAVADRGRSIDKKGGGGGFFGCPGRDSSRTFLQSTQGKNNQRCDTGYGWFSDSTEPTP